MLIGVVLILQGLAGAATPWVPDVLLMGIVSGIAAFFTGAAVTGILIWVFYMMTFFFPLGMSAKDMATLSGSFWAI